MKKLAANLGALAMGLVSLAVTVGLLVGLEAALDFDLFSFMLWFVVPVGAFATGLLVGFGYYLGAVKLHAKPTAAVTWAMIALGALAQVVLYYAHYWRATALDGGPVRSYVDFVHFTAWSLSHAHYGIAVYGTTHGSVEVGWWGFGIAAIQFFALVFGSWAVALVLAEKPYCDDCGRYAADITKKVVRFSGDMTTVDALRKLPALSDEYFDAVRALTGEGAALELELLRCPDCRKEALVERPMFPDKDGKLGYKGDAYRTSWTAAGRSVEPQLASLGS
jgi:hypothetical protein